MLLSILLVCTQGRAENLDEAWGIALSVNGRLRAQQQESLASGHNVAAARTERGPQVTTITIHTLIAPRPSFDSLGPSPSRSNTTRRGGGTRRNGNSTTGGIGLGSFGFFGQGRRTCRSRMLQSFSRFARAAGFATT